MTQENLKIRYYEYIRKSSEDKSRQILSLESQEEELKKFSPNDPDSIVDTLKESRSAKKPGRPVFNQMMDNIAMGKAQGIKVWHPDRLSRNPIDAARLINLM